MGLYERIIGTDPEVQDGTVKGVSSHEIMAALYEWQDAAVSRADIISAFSLRVEDEADLDWLKGKFAAATSKKEFAEGVHRILLLAEGRKLGYDTKATFVARINALAV